jgi:hypothetical protein
MVSPLGNLYYHCLERRGREVVMEVRLGWEPETSIEKVWLLGV